MAELGETSDPVQLVPGNVPAVTARMYDLGDYARSLDEAGQGLSRIDTRECWQGDAGEAFRERYRGEPKRWVVAGECFAATAKALDSYSWTLSWAQGKAADAIREWARGVAQTEADEKSFARAEQRARDDAARTGVPVVIGAFVDTGEPTRQAARETLADTRRQLADVARATAAKIWEACEPAPPKPTWVDGIGDGLGWLGGQAQDAGIAVVNGAASLGNAMLNHLDDVGLLFAGVGMIAAGTGGEVGGVALDATGAGAVAGVPINIATAGVIAAGAGLAGAGAVGLGIHAATDSRVQVLENREAPSQPGAAGRRGTPTDRKADQLNKRTLEAAERELNGETVKINPRDSEPFDHVQKVNNAQRGLRNRIEELQTIIRDSRSGDADRASAQAELSKAYKLLEYSKKFVPLPPK